MPVPQNHTHVLSAVAPVRTGSFLARFHVLCLCVLAICNPTTSVAADSEEPAADEAASDTGQAGKKADTKPKDLPDRIFAPLDDGVADINRDMNHELDKLDKKNKSAQDD